MEEYYQRVRDYWKYGFERDKVIPDWVYYIVGFLGVGLGIYNKWGFIFVMVATYKLASREGRREGFIDGFDERGSLAESCNEKSTSLEDEMDDTIKHFRKI